MGLGINDDNYLKGYQECLDYYRDNAINPDGRVWPRWAYSNEDAMPNIFTDKGFYEAQWGYLLDSNPDIVINVAELFDQTCNVDWLKAHQQSCEKALDWILNRDTNDNGLVEMITDSLEQKRGSDWIDIIWASYENAFVNAKLYRALTLWADIENLLGNESKEKHYRDFATKMKASFNKPVSKGGFWDKENNCYVHWREKDGSIHGRNMVTPVNFMAIAYGICDDATRSRTILDTIEAQMQKENLFFWPLCLYTYGPGEGNDWQFPFPNYENGDIFLSWGSVAAKAYSTYKPELAVKYINKVLTQYSKDGLAFQRYGRAKQDGLGDDILSGNALSVVGLYQAIYGINPKYNRFYLEPHITPELAGTQVKYNYRNQKLTIDLDVNNYAVSNGQFKVVSKQNFGFYANRNELLYFRGNDSKPSVNVLVPPNSTLMLNVKDRKKLTYQVNDLSQILSIRFWSIKRRMKKF
ncbi:MAG: trehalase family glycosidase [Bacteroidota bacterium]